MNKLFFIIAFLLLNLFSENDSFSQDLTQLQFSEISNMGSYGRSVSNAGDVNNDGFSDIIIGALSENMNTGAAFIYLGGIHMDTISDINFSGESEYTDFGISVSGAGDVNGDGFDDVIIGASRINSFKGKAYVFFGGQNMNNIPDVIINGESIGSDFGGSVSGGDLNGDGYNDLIIGAPGYSTNQFFHAGRIYVYYGGVNMDTIPDVVFTGESAYSELGSNVICSGDFNGDGYSDIGVGAYYYDLGKGRAYIFFGSLNMDNIPDVVMTGVAGEDHGLGACIANAGDVNNDSYTDLIVGDGYTNYIGKAKLYYGGPGMDSIADKVFYGETNNDWFAGWGSEVSGAGDINHDGFDDVIIGAHANSNGKVYVYFGSDNMNTEADLILNGENGFANFGFSVSGAGDINADGYSDFLVGADSYPQGKAYLYYYSGSLNNYVSATTPVMNTVNADKSTDISIVFNRDMNVPTLTGNNIKVNAEYTGIVPVNISYNPSLKTLIIDPQNDFRAGEKISVTLTSGIQTLNNLNVTPYIFSFLIEATGGTGKFHIIDSLDASGNVRIGDVDVDGDIDLIVGNTLNSIQRVKIYKNDGHGHFSYFRDVQGAYQSFIVADFDSDGDPDILSEAENDQVRLFLNDGLGNFSPSLLSGGFIGKPADLDGDGDPDIARIYSGYDVITAKNEDGLFIPQDPVNIPIHCQEPYYYSFPFIEIADMDNDGDPDIAEFTLSYFDFISGIFTGCRSLEIIENSGSGIFTNSTLQNENFVEGYSVLDKYSYTVLNYDNDDDVDILTSFSKGTNLGNGTYQFEPVQNIFNTIHSADFDGDGDLDITSVAYRTINPNKIFLLNDGTGNFNIDSNLNSNDLSEILYTADFDGDGDLDILESNNSKLMIASNVDCEISGPSNVLVNSQPVAYSVSENVGFWILSNYDQTQATIVSGDEDDTVIVDPGGVTGHFVLYYQDNRTLFCAKHVYVDAPLPVELSAFTSSVNARDIVLNWTTSYELNNSGFEIERAIDNGQLIIDSWSKAGYVEGNGTVSEPRDYTFTDKNLQSGNYKYRLKQTDFNGNFEYFELDGAVSIGIPDKFSLSQNYPNPFNPVTNIEFGISSAAGGLGFVTLKIYDATGREVVTLVNEVKEPGYYTIKFNAANLASGVYFYRMTAGDFVAVKKLVVLK